ncbi:MAG TPA: DNA-3-methyladenine glycosylase 2 family protein [Marmoricola sp.]|nr:DNA-3-methyladenine glycosylase 2 family protein [Marmoricola sp.]
MPETPALERAWRPSWPCPVPQILGSLRRGAGDPTYLRDPDGTVWKGWRTPAGPVTLGVRPLDGAGEVHATAWGSGAEWVLDGLPALLGAGDDPSGFEPQHDVLATAWRSHPHWRVPRTRLVMDALLPAILEQKVTGQEAFTSFRRLVRRYGEAAPGAAAVRRGLLVAPDAATVRSIPSWEWLRMHVDQARSRTILRAVEVAPALERLVDVTAAEADRRLRTLPGIGGWTSAEVRARALGDPDAVSFGDYHVAKDIGWALTGRPVDDEQLAVLLEPYVGHRLRVQVLVGLAGLRRPRRGPRMTLPTHLPEAVRRR